MSNLSGRDRGHFLLTSTYLPTYLPVWPDLATFHHFGMMLKSYRHFERVHLVLGKIFKLLWLILYAIEQIFIALNGQKLIKKSIHLVTLLPPYLPTYPPTYLPSFEANATTQISTKTGLKQKQTKNLKQIWRLWPVCRSISVWPVSSRVDKWSFQLGDRMSFSISFTLYLYLYGRAEASFWTKYPNRCFEERRWRFRS